MTPAINKDRPKREAVQRTASHRRWGEIRMAENVLFSLRVTLPLFLVMVVGAVLRRRGYFDEPFLDRVNTFLYGIALPAKLFLDVAQSDLRKLADWPYALSCAGAICLGFGLAWLYARLVLRDAAQMGTFVHGAFRGNFVYIGLALVGNVLGHSAGATGAQVLIFLIPLYNILAVLVLTAAGGRGEAGNAGRLVKKILTNPMLLAILAAIPFSALRLPLFQPVEATLNYLGSGATALSLLVIGASLSIPSLRRRLREILLACLYKLVLQPLLLLPYFLFVLPCTLEQMAVAFVMLGAPSAANVYVMTKKMGGDEELATGILVGSEALSLFTMTGWIFLLRTLGAL